MGLSSSQGRLLMLTSKLSDIELQEVMIGQRQMQLAWDTEKVAKEYQESMNNYKLAINLPEKNEEGQRKEDLTYENMTSLGYLVTNADKQIYLKKDENGNWIVPKDTNGKDILSIDKATGKAVIGDKKYDIVDGTKIYSNPKVLQNMILNSAVFLYNAIEQDDDGISLGLLPKESDMERVLDTSDDSEAQSKYEYETASIARKDNQLDLELKQLETQHEVVMKEYDTVKEVIGKNVERTFKLFSNG